ncbi:discoidin domain-containing protein [Cohnella rhizosphaerae]|uniref:Discoidin domain-containing protein n=1 Tax=Cohnella rhizosphaerae TaxID=1457232 RepID=A0A9X4KWY8_9BACL|nr:discoidin domain-containing protein [Cohnella rhizosphaerae]MDG0812811.1 discoidin domain-containing protein [Cohnella rhizosphaerae]
MEKKVKLKVFMTLAAGVIGALGFSAPQASASIDRFIIGAYGNPEGANINATQFQYLNNAHVNEIQLSWGYDQSNTATPVQQILGLANQYGIKVQVSDIRMRPWWYEDLTHAQIDSIIGDVTSSYSSYPATDGYVAFDEPGNTTKDIDRAGYANKKFLSFMPNANNSLNLLPIYAYGGMGYTGYRDYVSRVINTAGAQNLKSLSYDFYPFPAGGGTASDYFQNAEIFREIALKYGIKNTMAYLQTGNFPGVRLPNQNEVRWNIYTNVAYGVKGYFTFVWWLPQSNTDMPYAVIAKDGTQSPVYLYLQNVNAEIEKLGPTLIGLDSLEVYHAGSWLPLGTNPVPSGYFWQPTNNVNNHIISHFKNAAGRNYVMVVNDDYSSSQTLSFNIPSKPSGITEVSKTTGLEAATNYNSSTGNISATFLPGEGKLYAITGSITNDFMVNDTDTNIIYTGSSWVYGNNSGSGQYNNDVHYMSGNDDYFEYTFNGTGVQFIGDLQATHGTADVYIDDVFQQTVDCYRVSTLAQQVLFSKSGLTSGTHTIKVVKKSGSYINVDAIKVFTSAVPTSELVPVATTFKHNDTDGKILYSGLSWGYDRDRGVGEFKDDIHFMTENNDYFEFTFTGTGVSYITDKRSNSGTVDIYIDGVFQQTVNCFNTSTLVQQSVYTKTGLTAGTHTIKGIKKSGTYVDVDAFVVTEANPSTLIKMSAGKSYTKSIQPSSSYPDTDNAESTNGIIAGPFSDGKSYGYNISSGQTINVDFTMDLSANKTLRLVKFLKQSGNIQNYAPDSITVYTSTDGINFTQKGQSTSAVNGWYEVKFADTTARYVKVKATKTYGSNADWLFVDEIEAYGI